MSGVKALLDDDDDDDAVFDVLSEGTILLEPDSTEGRSSSPIESIEAVEVASSDELVTVVTDRFRICFRLL